MKQLKHIWFIALKDLKIFATDRAGVFFFIIFPFMFIILFNFLMKGVGGEDQRRYAGQHDRSGAHGARLQGDVQGAVAQAP